MSSFGASAEASRKIIYMCMLIVLPPCSIGLTRNYPLRGHFLGVLTHTTAWDRLWVGEQTQVLV